MCVCEERDRDGAYSKFQEDDEQNRRAKWNKDYFEYYLYFVKFLEKQTHDTNEVKRGCGVDRRALLSTGFLLSA